MARIAVVGGGIAGLAAAYALRDHDVTVIEGTDRVGGKLRAGEVGGVVVDEGAEALLRRRPEALDLAAAVGLGAALVTPSTTTASVWSRGRLRRLPPGTLLGVPRSIASLRGVLGAGEVARAAADLVLPGDGGGDGDVAVGALVGRRLGRAVVERLVDPLLGGVYAGRADELSVQATLPALATARGSLVRRVRASVPATSAEPVFATLPDGLGSLPPAVLRASGAHLIAGRLVRRLERGPAGFRVVHGPTADERALDADAVVLAVPATPAGRLLRDVAPAAATELAAIESASVAIVTTVWSHGSLPQVGGSGYLVPSPAGRPVKAVTFLSSKWPHFPDDVVIARASLGRHGESAVLQRDDEDLVDAVTAELALTVGARGRPAASRVTRWGGALPQYAVGHVDRVRRIRAAVAAVPGLAVCGSTYDGVGVPACIASASAAAEQVRAAVSSR